jgi:hypothetical protein
MEKVLFPQGPNREKLEANATSKERGVMTDGLLEEL